MTNDVPDAKLFLILYSGADMSQLGIGVMLSHLGGNDDSVKAWLRVVNKEIASLSITDDAFRIEMADGTSVVLFDDGQSCCEHRYMRSDDDLAYHIGGTLLDAEVKSARETTEGEWGDVHEIAFLVVTTSKGVITVANHNEHNGYYGGFSIRAREG